MRILQEPKNALVKQYQTLLALDGVDAGSSRRRRWKRSRRLALEPARRARAGLRGVLENVMTDIMFRIPSDETSINTCDVITPGVRDRVRAGTADRTRRARIALPSGTASPKKGGGAGRPAAPTDTKAHNRYNQHQTWAGHAGFARVFCQL